MGLLGEIRALGLHGVCIHPRFLLCFHPCLCPQGYRQEQRELRAGWGAPGGEISEEKVLGQCRVVGGESTGDSKNKCSRPGLVSFSKEMQFCAFIYR